MCGIAGIIGNLRPGQASECIKRMLVALAPRGPDGEGVESWHGALLAHRRLSIFDLSSAGKQPMVSADGQTGIVFNGAIYNFLELRAILKTSGYRFVSQTDTEVLLHGYDAWGIDRLVDRLRGMFSFAIWNNRERTVTMVRDRLGVKPLVYTVRGGQIAFASSAQALYSAGFANEFNGSAVLDFLEHGWIPDDRAIFESIQKVPAATIVQWRDGRLTERKYWEAPRALATGSIRFQDAVERTEELLLEAVRIRSFADVPVGALLSGGIDSALVCWAMAKLKVPITAFTIGTPDDPGDEANEARRTSKLLGISHKVIELPSTEHPPLDELVSAYGEPFASPSALGMLRVSKAVKSSVTVLLTGDGGDDVFLGYPRHRHMWWAQRLATTLPRGVATAWPRVRSLVARTPYFRRPMHFLDYATQGLSSATANADLMKFYSQYKMLGPRFNIANRRQELSPSIDSARQLLEQFLNYEWRTQFTGEYMTKVDGATMLHGVEARSPFLDHKLWEYAASLPYEVRLHRSELKAVLRHIVKTRVHPEVAHRRKRGFTIPVEKWLLSEGKMKLNELAADSLLESEQWMQPGSIRRAVDDATNSGRVPSHLWSLLVLENWMRHHVATARVV